MPGAVARDGIHLQNGDFDLALARLLPLWRADRLPPAARYRLAYAALKTARADLGSRALDSLKGPPLASQARTPRTAVRRCRSRPWECM